VTNTSTAPSVRTRARYRLDLAISRGSVALIGYLGAVMVAVILVSATVLTVLRLSGINGGTRLGFAEAFWQSMLRVLGRGSFSADQQWPTRLLSLLITVTGIFLAGALIGLISTAINQRIANLRKGRSLVLERGHTLVLGWSPRLPVILAELAIANAGQRHASFVVLADRCKIEMEDELRRLVPDTGTTRVVCRTGDPSKPADLELVNIAQARSVIALAGTGGDAAVVKAVLAARSLDPAFAHTRLVAELQSTGAAATLRRLTANRIATVHADQVISQVTAQACHQSGLTEVFRDLLGFDGNDIYFAAAPELVGHTYAEALLAYRTSSVIGLCRDGRVDLNPSPDTVITGADEVIAISADDTTLVFTGFTTPPMSPRAAADEFSEAPQRIAVIGWSELGAKVLDELDQFLAAGSVVDLLVDRERCSTAPARTYSHCRVNVHLLAGGPEPMLALLAQHQYDQVIVLGYRNELSPADADAHTMLTLLALNQELGEADHPPRVVAEMLDRANVAIARTTGVDDFIVSDELSSLMIAQVSERLELQDVFHELFDAEGCFLALHPAAPYASGAPVPFASVVAAAAARGHSAVGYRIGTSPVVLNPAKSDLIELGPADQVLILGARPMRASATGTSRSNATQPATSRPALTKRPAPVRSPVRRGRTPARA
jgi:Trk K+ transport system NAD-binding subunit